MNAELDSDEIETLKLPQKFCTLDKLNPREFELDLEVAHAKVRWEQSEKGEKCDVIHDPTNTSPGLCPRGVDGVGVSKEEQLKCDILEAKIREPYDAFNLSLDMTKRRATDMPGNTFVRLPGLLNPILESALVLRKEAYLKEFFT